MNAMASQDDTQRRTTRATYLGLRLPNGDVSGPLPTADRLRIVDPGSRLGWVELRWRGEILGYVQAEGDA